MHPLLIDIHYQNQRYPNQLRRAAERAVAERAAAERNASVGSASDTASPTASPKATPPPSRRQSSIASFLSRRKKSRTTSISEEANNGKEEPAAEESSDSDPDPPSQGARRKSSVGSLLSRSRKKNKDKGEWALALEPDPKRRPLTPPQLEQPSGKSRARQFCEQDKCAFLSWTSYEIREQIYLEVLGSGLIYVREPQLAKREPYPTGKCLKLMCRMGDETVPIDPRNFRRLMQTCRRMYADGLHILYSTSPLHFHTKDGFSAFTRQVVPGRLHLLRSIRLHLELPYLLFPERGDAKRLFDEKWWKGLWKFLRRLQGLKELQASLLARSHVEISPSFPEWPSERLKLLLFAPLMKMTHLRNFVLEVSWPLEEDIVEEETEEEEEDPGPLVQLEPGPPRNDVHTEPRRTEGMKPIGNAPFELRRMRFLSVEDAQLDSTYAQTGRAGSQSSQAGEPGQASAANAQNDETHHDANQRNDNISGPTDVGNL